MQTFVLAVLGAFAMAGALRFRLKSLVSAFLITAPLLGAFLVGARLYYGLVLENAYDKDKIIRQMQSMQDTVSMEVFRTSAAPVDEDLSRPALQRIRERGYLRVGYVGGGELLPFDYFNDQGKLVGFDVAMAQNLAAELGVGLQLVPVRRGALAEALNTGICDIVMSAIVVTPERAHAMAFSTPYLDLTFAYVVRDHRRDEFQNDVAYGGNAPRLAVLNIPHYIELVRKRMPNAKLTVIDDAREFFEDRNDKFDALPFAAEMGAAWSLLYPQYSVAIPRREVVRIPIGYPVGLNQREWLAFVDAWVNLQKKEGAIQKFYDYWILGRNAVPAEPRWSVIRNVLGWVN